MTQHEEQMINSINFYIDKYMNSKWHSVNTYCFAPERNKGRQYKIFMHVDNWNRHDTEELVDYIKWFGTHILTEFMKCGRNGEYYLAIMFDMIRNKE